MARIRTARALAALAAVPLLLGAAAGAAQAAAGPLNYTVANTPVGTVVGDPARVAANNLGTTAAAQQSANGRGAANDSRIAGIDGSPFATVNQPENHPVVTFVVID
ncbi:hypothetical protein RM780_20180 [Streptomyces sp. DSM 44917]|uniref:Chaplin domain-containing protein n=1 Tax=Streptomyces boetiae TaxID=3075541 RepID=A0ABU2LD94_9ACTN|nr:hypothetical protein [Streptomyces sp. DSM 44917]MDT0309262.1 hypothetical protein [Streptomyces sp. DSM 44917]